MAILTALFLLGGMFMIVDTYSPALRIVLQVACSIILGLGIAVYIISRMERHKS